MKTKDPSLKFTCPVCNAMPKQRCKLSAGTGFRIESHRHRRDLTIEKLARVLKTGKRKS